MCRSTGSGATRISRRFAPPMDSRNSPAPPGPELLQAIDHTGLPVLGSNSTVGSRISPMQTVPTDASDRGSNTLGPIRRPGTWGENRADAGKSGRYDSPVSYTHLRAH